MIAITVFAAIVWVIFVFTITGWLLQPSPAHGQTTAEPCSEADWAEAEGVGRYRPSGAFCVEDYGPYTQGQLDAWANAAVDPNLRRDAPFGNAEEYQRYVEARSNPETIRRLQTERARAIAEARGRVGERLLTTAAAPPPDVSIDQTSQSDREEAVVVALNTFWRENWRAQFPSAPREYNAAPIIFGPVSGDGILGLYTGRTIYVENRTQYRPWPTPVLVAAHEVGHRVQDLLGMDMSGGFGLEMQADCLGGVWAHHEVRRSGGVIVDDDIAEYRRRFRDDPHIAGFNQGYRSGRAVDCGRFT